MRATGTHKDCLLLPLLNKFDINLIYSPAMSAPPPYTPPQGYQTQPVVTNAPVPGYMPSKLLCMQIVAFTCNFH